MNFKFLLINPWIYDFAAYNLWARPLGLLKVAEFLSQYNVELFFIDLCDGFDCKKFGIGKYESEEIDKPEILRKIPRKYKRYGISKDSFVEKLRKIGRVDLVFITSIMAYWWLAVRDTVRIIRDFYGDIPVIVGGIYATLYREHAERNIGADFIYIGHLDERLLDIIESFGIKLKRLREKPKYWWQIGFYDKISYAPVLTSTGCPFRCPYCASGILNKTFSQRENEEVISEIEGLYSFGVRDFAFYDDALLCYPERHIKPILKEIIGKNLRVRFHTPNGLGVRFIDRELSELMKLSGFETLRLSLETIDIKRQIETGGKVSNEEIERAVFYLKEAGFSSSQIGVYLMYGLPGQSLDEVKAGVEFIKKLKVRIHLTEFSPIRGTYYWEKLVKEGIITDDLDPLFTNNTIFSEIYLNYNREELSSLKVDVNQFNFMLSDRK